ncbi:MAG: TonB-dependent receptor [Xanthomonadales bacterium]
MTHSTRNKLIQTLCILTLLALLGLVNGPVLAQEDEDSLLEEVTVTASRLRQSGFDAPTPVTVLGVEDMQVRGTTNVADIINEVPAFTPTLTPQSTVLNSRQNGVNGLDLRGLGPNRNLILVNGRRHVPFDEFGIVDINAIPSIAVKRIEIVTGGASAAWGSDAVSGVVNIIYDTDLEGGKIEAQYGESDAGDAENARISGAFGNHFSDDRGHFMVAFEYFDNDGIPEAKVRDWVRKHPGLLVNPLDTGPNDGIPQFVIRNDATLFLASPNGVTLPLGLPTDNLEFLPDGTAIPRALGIPGGNLMQGGSGSFLPDRDALDIPVERQSILGTLDYQFTDHVRFFSEASYTKSETRGQIVDAFMFGGTIFSGNPYLPASVQETMDVTGVPFLVLFRTFEEFPPISSVNENENKRVVIGLDGEFGNNWWWETYYQYGRAKFSNDQANNLLTANLANAANAVVDPVSGEIVCAANAGGAGGAPGCVPINLFGKGSPSQAAIDYITATGMALTTLKQQVVSATIGGDIFEGWAGPISAAFGAEFRDESLDRTVDDNNDNFRFLITNAQPLSGDIDIKELFTEVLVPLISGKQELNFNGAVRWADYSTVGSTVSWKGGLVYQPTASWMFRGSVSQDIRAPSIGETFLETLLLFDDVTNPFTGGQDFIQVFNTGNENLKEEEAITTTVGVVWSPTQADLQFSVDWYNIDLEDGIGSISNQEIVNRCAAGAQEFCELIDFAPNGSITSLTNTLLNLGTFEVEGVDIAASYRVPLGSGSFGFNLLGSYLIKKDIAPQGADPVDVVGELSVLSGFGTPEWKTRLGASYDQGPWGLYGQVRYISSGKYDPNWGPEQLSPEDNSIGAQYYFDLSAYYRFGMGSLDKLELYGGVSNLFDRNPPVVPVDFISNIATNPTHYDVIGRRYYAGIRLAF